MKQFCCGDVVPGWLPVSEAADDRILHEVFSSSIFRDQALGPVRSGKVEELRSTLNEAAAA